MPTAKNRDRMRSLRKPLVRRPRLREKVPFLRSTADARVQMLSSIAIIFGYQVAGELISRLSGIPVPGPVIGMVLMLLSFFVRDDLINRVRPSAGVLLANLSLLFVPAGVGIMRHGQRFVDEGVGIMIALVASTVIAMVVTAYVIIAMQKWLKLSDED